MVGALAVAAAVLAGWLWWGQQSVHADPPGEGGSPAAPAMPVTERSGVSAASSDTIMVHVSGAVANPGLVSVPAGARVADVVAAAGGADRSADVAGINLAAPVADGDQVVVPSVVEPGTVAGDPGGIADVGEGAGAAADGRVMLNRADPADLEQLPGVGPVIAGRIVAYREANGPFQTVEDLLDVSGIGEAKLAAIRDLVIVP